MSEAAANQGEALWISQQQSPQELNDSGRGLECLRVFLFFFFLIGVKVCEMSVGGT